MLSWIWVACVDKHPPTTSPYPSLASGQWSRENKMAAVLKRIPRSSIGQNLRILTTIRDGNLSRRNISSFVNVDVKDSVAVLELNRKPVNSFSLEFVQEITSSLKSLEENINIRGVILTSGCNKVFSAGLDLVNEMHNPDRQRLTKYWREFRNMFVQLYGSRLTTIAAINGHAIAGGCVLASGCDYRIMASNYTIGLNEVVAGVQIPPWVAKTYINLVGYRVAEEDILLGVTFPSDVALKKGVVNKVVPQENILVESHKEMERWLKLPDFGRVLTKNNLRGDFLQTMKDTEEEDVKGFTDYVFRETTQKLIQEQIDRISKKNKK